MKKQRQAGFLTIVGWFIVQCNLESTQGSAASTFLNCATGCDHNGTACVCRCLFMMHLMKAWKNMSRHVKNELNCCKSVGEVQGTIAYPTSTARMAKVKGQRFVATDYLFVARCHK